MTIKRFSKRSLTIEMDRNVKQMLKLIEDDGDSFAKKAEMYYQKRPELVSLVEDFYRGYRSLAERYDYVTGGEWSKNIPSDLQSQASGTSDNGSEPSSTLPCASPRKVGRRISGANRAAGFDVFLGWGSGNGYDASHKDGEYGSSTMTEDSDDEFDDASSINSCPGLYGNGGGDHGMNRRVMDLEIELRDVKEKLYINEEARAEGSSRGTRVDNGEDFRTRIHAYEQELRILNQKLRLSEEEITKLKIELQKYKSMESSNFQGDIEKQEDLHRKILEPEGTNVEMDMDIVKSLREELRITREKLESSEMQIASMKFEASKTAESIQHWREQLNLAQGDIAAWKTKFNSEKRETTKLQERLEKFKTNKEKEIRDLKTAASDAEEKIFLEKSRLKEEIKEGKNNIKDLNEILDALKLERDNLIEEVGSLKEDIISRDNQIEQLDMDLNQLHMEHVQLIGGIEEAHAKVEELKSRATELEEEIERQRIEIIEGAEEKREAIRQLCFSLEHYRNCYNLLREAFIGNKRFPVLASKIYA